MRTRARVDLTTRSGRYLARKRGLDVPKRRSGVPPTPFWELVSTQGDGCWEWLGKVDRCGYGVYLKGGRHQAHRWSWRHDHEMDIPRGMVVRHQCDNPKCVRPDHLILGTHADNVRDRMGKDRGAKGSMLASSILTEADVLLIRAEYRPESIRGKHDGNTSALATRFGVSRYVIWNVVTGRSWRHVS